MLQVLSCILLGFSLVLWLTANYKVTQCVEHAPLDALNIRNSLNKVSNLNKGSNSRTDPPTKPTEAIEDIVDWLNNNIPSSVKWNQSMCPAVQRSLTDVGFHDDSSLTVIGAVNVSFKETEFDDTLLDQLEVSGLLLTTLGIIDNTIGLDVSILEAFRPAIISLANNNLMRTSNDALTGLVHTLNILDIDWLGVNAKKYTISRIGNMKVGYLAFCSLSRCAESGFLPYAPIRYSPKTSRELVEELKKYGVDTIVVLVYWGSEHSYFPDETALYVARHLAEIPEVSVIIGHHPQHVQGHAYFRDTLVLFSPGNFLVQDNSLSLCWHRIHNNQWIYSNRVECISIHPSLRHGLLERELQTRLYKISFHKESPPISQYVTLKLDISVSNGGLRHPVFDNEHKWITACGDYDKECLSCESY